MPWNPDLPLSGDNRPEYDPTDPRPELAQVFFPKRVPRTPVNTGPPLAPMNGNGASPYATKALTDEVATVARAIPGTRNATLNTSAFNLAQLVPGGYLPHDATRDALRDAALATGLPSHEIDNTLDSAFEAGMATPRTITGNTNGDGYTPPEVTVLPDEWFAPLVQGDGTTEGLEPAPNALADRIPFVDWHELWADATPQEWIVEPLIPARRLVALFSPPKVGKSLLMLEIAAGVATGRAVLGIMPHQRRVLYVDFENDTRGDIRPRLLAMGYTPDELTGHLFYASFPNMDYLDTAMGGWMLHQRALECGAELVVIDTISRAVRGEENDNDTWLAFYRHTGVRLKASGIACVRLDHSGKDWSKGMRGGSAKAGDVDAAWSMEPITDTTLRLECTANRLPITERVLMVERHTDPLTHQVTTRSTRQVYDAEAERVLGELDRLGVPVERGRPSCKAALDAAGVEYPERRLWLFVKWRKERAEAETKHRATDQWRGPYADDDDDD